MKHHLFLFIVLASQPLGAAAQEAPTPDTDVVPLPSIQAPSQPELSAAAGHLDLSLDATGFFYNVENKLPFAKGYTATGFRLTPTLLYGLNDRTQLRAGLNATMLAGCDSLHELRPLLSLTYSPCPQLTLVVGTLYGSMAHHLDAPLYDPQRWVYHHLEEGIQILTQLSHWHSDTWLDWWHYLVPNTPDQEYFTFGTDHTFSLLTINSGTQTLSIDNPLQTNHRWAVELPATFIAHHRGGELKTIDTTTLTHFNERIGLRLSHTIANQHTSHNWTLDAPLYLFHLSNHNASGHALHPTLAYTWQHNPPQQSWHLTARGGLWMGDGYQSYFGLPQFQSVAPLAPATDVTRRTMLTFSIALQHTYRNTQVGLATQCYYDTDLRKADVTIGLYLRGHQKIRLL